MTELDLITKLKGETIDLKAKLSALTAEDIDHQIDMRLKAEAEVARLRALLEEAKTALDEAVAWYEAGIDDDALDKLTKEEGRG